MSYGVTIGDIVKKKSARAIRDHTIRDYTKSGGKNVPRSGYDIRLLDKVQLLRARLQAAVDALEALLPAAVPCLQRDRAQAVVRGERALMNPTPWPPRLFPFQVLPDK